MRAGTHYTATDTDDYKIVRQKVSENFDGWPEEDLGTPENGCHKDEGIKGPPQIYHGAWIGQRFLKGRYIIVRKLGYGQHANVWLARDLVWANSVPVSYISSLIVRRLVGKSASLQSKS